MVRVTGEPERRLFLPPFLILRARHPDQHLPWSARSFSSPLVLPPPPRPAPTPLRVRVPHRASPTPLAELHPSTPHSAKRLSSRLAVLRRSRRLRSARRQRRMLLLPLRLRLPQMATIRQQATRSPSLLHRSRGVASSLLP